MNALREELGLPSMALSTRELALAPRVIHVTETVALRPAGAQKKVNSAPLELLRAATALIPNQPTTEQWQTIKQAILDLQHAP